MSNYFDPKIPKKREFGDYGEEQATQYLKQQGFTILERNYKKFYGEIDIIAQKNNLLIFVEVKTRKTTYFSLSELIIPSKQRKIIKTAESYIAKKRFIDTTFRFDVALLHNSMNGFQVTYIPNAFTKHETY